MNLSTQLEKLGKAKNIGSSSFDPGCPSCGEKDRLEYENGVRTYVCGYRQAHEAVLPCQRNLHHLAELVKECCDDESSDG